MGAATHSTEPESWRLRRRGPAGVLSWQALVGLILGLLLVLGFAARFTGGLAGLSWRLSCLGYAAICLLRGVDGRRAAMLWTLWLPFLLAVALDAALLQRMAGLADLARQLFIFGFGAIVFGAARDPVTRRVGFWALFFAAFAILAYTLLQTLPLLSSGWSYAGARALKGKSFQGGFNANEVCFAALAGLIASYREDLVPRWICLGMVALTGLCSVLLGARAPAMALLGGALAAFIILPVPSWPIFAGRRSSGSAAAALVNGGLLALLFSRVDAIAHSAYAVQLAGRAALWQIALGAWPQAPWLGFGPGSFQAVIHANLGKAHFSSPDEFQSLYALQAGGFHNIWLSVLVERGVVGLAGLFASWCLLLGFALAYAGQMPQASRWVLLTLLIGMLFRGQVEMAGLFDDADGPINQIVMTVIGLTLPGPSRAARPPPYRARDLAAQAAAGHTHP